MMKPIVNQASFQDEKLYPGMSGYPGYHTGFETFDLVDRIYDPEFKVPILKLSSRIVV